MAVTIGTSAGRYCRNVRRRTRKVVVASVLVVVALAAWVVPAFSEPPHRTADCDAPDYSWGYDALGRRWTCGDHWLIRIGVYGVLGV